MKKQNKQKSWQKKKKKRTRFEVCFLDLIKYGIISGQI